MKIMLFDIDGVLVKPFGYRKAYFDTCKWLIDQGNLPTNVPAADIPALFESFGVTSEWDMLALTGAILVNNVCLNQSIQLKSQTLEMALQELKNIDLTPLTINFRESIFTISDTFHMNEIPSIGLLQNAGERLSGIPGHLLTDILGYTREAKIALITRIFQNFVLGSQVFSDTYGIKPLFACDSYLKEYDKPLLEPDVRDELFRKRDQEKFCFAALTARPSLGPRDIIGKSIQDYSPEAELALDVIQMPDMPLIGYGRLQYAQSVYGILADSLIKPDAFHTFAAIFALITGSEKKGIEAAGEMRENKAIPDWIRKQMPSEIKLSVFEDSQGGIRSVIHAAEQLNRYGLKTNSHLYGVTRNADKEKSLTQLGATIFPDINSAIKYDFNI